MTEERRSIKFMLALSPSERTALDKLASRERLPAAAVVRRLVWNEARRRGLLFGADDKQNEKTAEAGS